MAPSEPTSPDLGPIETTPEQIVVFDRAQRRWTTHLAPTGVVIVVRSAIPGRPARERVVTGLDRANALNLVDALTWAAQCQPVIPQGPLTTWRSRQVRRKDPVMDGRWAGLG